MLTLMFIFEAYFDGVLKCSRCISDKTSSRWLTVMMNTRGGVAINSDTKEMITIKEMKDAVAIRTGSILESYQKLIHVLSSNFSFFYADIKAEHQ